MSNNPACKQAFRQNYHWYRYPFRAFYLIMEKPHSLSGKTNTRYASTKTIIKDNLDNYGQCYFGILANLPKWFLSPVLQVCRTDLFGLLSVVPVVFIIWLSLFFVLRIVFPVRRTGVFSVFVNKKIFVFVFVLALRVLFFLQKVTKKLAHVRINV